MKTFKSIIPNYISINMGCDPELFLSKKGFVIGSEKVIPEDGLLSIDPYGNKGRALVVRDGIQIELHPTPRTCREQLWGSIRDCFVELNKCLGKNKGVKLDFRGMIKVSKKEFDSLDDKSKMFGCIPSFNIYTRSVSEIKVDPMKYRYRSGGGHIHLGHLENPDLVTLFKTPKRAIAMLDIILGNTCVLLDRDPGNVERRKTYGRAGEYREKDYGIEYRVLSNFWLNNYQLMSFVFGMARFAIMICFYSSKEDPYEDAILEAVDMKDIEKAINKNDFNLAMDNFNKIAPIIEDITDPKVSIINMHNGMSYTKHPISYPLNNNIDLFRHFVKKGLKYWFSDDPYKGWLKTSRGFGWENWLINVVKNDTKIIGKVKNLFK